MRMTTRMPGLASAKATIDLTNNASETKWNPVATKKERERWNDWGIGLLQQGDVKGAQETVAAARTEVPEPQLRLYDRIASKPGHPVCVTVNGGRCGGCHLKVPTHIEVQAKAGVEITTCDQCGRVVYWAS